MSVVTKFKFSSVNINIITHHIKCTVMTTSQGSTISRQQINGEAFVCGSRSPVTLTACVASEARRLFTAANQQLNGKSRTWQRCDYPLYGYCWIQRILARMRHFQAGCVAGGVLTIHTQIKVCCMSVRARVLL